VLELPPNPQAACLLRKTSDNIGPVERKFTGLFFVLRPDTLENSHTHSDMTVTIQGTQT